METSQQQDELEIDLLELFYVLLNKIGVILVIGLFAAIITAAINLYVLKPTYTSTTKLYIFSKDNAISSLTDLQMGSQLTKDYMVLIKSRPVTEQVINNLGLIMEHEELLSIMQISNPSDTRILEISVEYGDAFLAKQIVDEIADVSSKRIAEIMNINQPNVVEAGVVAEQKTGPNVTRNVVIWSFLAVFVASAVIIIRHIMDDTIKSAEEIERFIGINAIGMIPLEQSQKEREKRQKRKSKRKHAAEVD